MKLATIKAPQLDKDDFDIALLYVKCNIGNAPEGHSHICSLLHDLLPNERSAHLNFAHNYNVEHKQRVCRESWIPYSDPSTSICPDFLI